MAKRDYYDILGVPRTASEADLKKAYRQMAIKYHPDKNPGDKEAEEKFKEAAEAYDVLSNADKRARYDRFGHQGVGGASGGGGGPHMNMEDIFSQFGDIFGDDSPFGSFFGGGGGRGRRNNSGSNIRVKVKLTLQEIAQGVEKKIKVNKQVPCTTCQGSGAKDRNAFSTCSTCKGSGQVRRVQNTFLGQMQTTSICPTCEGEGRMITSKCGSCQGSGRQQGEEVISIRIPAGVAEGMQMSMSQKGNAGERGGVAGDLIIQFEEIEDALLKRDGNNVLYDLNLSFPDAVMGTSVEIPTVDGKVKVNIKSGTQAGEVLRLKGKGIPILNGYGKGDQLIQVNVWTPQKLSAEEKEMMEKLKQSDNFIPKPGDNTRSFFDRMREFFQ